MPTYILICSIFIMQQIAEKTRMRSCTILAIS